MNTPSEFSNLVESTPICLALVDVDQKLVWGNKAWCEYTGFDCTDPLSATLAVHPDEQASVSKTIEQFFNKPRRITKEFQYQRHDGEFRAFQLVGAPLEQDQKVVGLVCVLTDITDQLMIEEQMLALNDSLEDMVDERTQGLKQANEELKATHSQMLHHEKMASIGAIIGMQKEGMQIGLASREHLYNAASDFVEAAGQGDVSRYFSNPENTPEPEPQPDPDMVKAQQDAQIKQQQMQMDAQNNQAKLVQDGQNNQEKLAQDAQNEQQKFELQREQMTIETELKREQMVAEFQLKREQMQMEAELKREQMIAEIQLKAALSTSDSNVGSSVRMGGEVG